MNRYISFNRKIATVVRLLILWERAKSVAGIPERSKPHKWIRVSIYYFSDLVIICLISCMLQTILCTSHRSIRSRSFVACKIIIRSLPYLLTDFRSFTSIIFFLISFYNT